jgi:CcmD family protein
MENSGYLFAVFGIVWLVLFIYVLMLINSQNRLQKEIKSLTKVLQEKGLDKKNI